MQNFIASEEPNISQTQKYNGQTKLEPWRIDKSLTVNSLQQEVDSYIAIYVLSLVHNNYTL